MSQDNRSCACARVFSCVRESIRLHRGQFSCWVVVLLPVHGKCEMRRADPDATQPHNLSRAKPLPLPSRPSLVGQPNRFHLYALSLTLPVPRLLPPPPSPPFAVRERIEMSGRDNRWEFDRKRLFDRTNYMATICKDLLQMVEVVDDFHKFLGPELKAVTGDSQGIDAVIQRVAAMVDPIENLNFDAFDKKHSAQWQVASPGPGGTSVCLRLPSRFASTICGCRQAGSFSTWVAQFRWDHCGTRSSLRVLNDKGSAYGWWGYAAPNGSPKTVTV